MAPPPGGGTAGVDPDDAFLTHVSPARGAAKQIPKKKGMTLCGMPIDSNFAGTISMIMVPWLFFVTLSCFFAFAYHRERLLVWGVTFTLSGFSLMFMVLDTRNRSGGSWYLFLGILCFFAVGFGAFCGIYNYETHMLQYWSYEENRLYSNVLPSEPAAAHNDAGKIIFSSDARVDTTRALGYKSGSVYCVAPILDDTQATRVEYWAAGMDCCMQRADFSCDDAWNAKARSGVVIVDNNNFMPTHRDYYLQAVREAEAAYQLVSAKNPILVRWVLDPQTVQDDFWRSGIGFLVAESCLSLLIFFIFGFVMHNVFSRRKDQEAAR